MDVVEDTGQKSLDFQVLGHGSSVHDTYLMIFTCNWPNLPHPCHVMSAGTQAPDERTADVFIGQESKHNTYAGITYTRSDRNTSLAYARQARMSASVK